MRNTHYLAILGGCLALVGVVWLLIVLLGGGSEVSISATNRADSVPATVVVERTPEPSTASTSATTSPPAAPTETPAASVTPTAIATPAASETPTAIATPAASETPTAIATPAASETPTAIATPAATETPTAIATPAASVTPAGRPGLGALQVRRLDATDLGTGSTEFSGVALNEQNNRLLIVDDEGLLFEFDLDAAGLPRVPPRRTLQIVVGGGDPEGIVWMSGTTYAVANENDGTIMIIDLSETATSVDRDSLQGIVTSGIAEVDGNGIEGVTVVTEAGEPPELLIGDERPASVYRIDLDDDSGQAQLLVADLGLSDLSDLAAGPAGVLTLLSDEDRRLVEVAVDDSGQTTVLGGFELTFADGRFEQPEGVARSRDGARLYVVGEAPGPGRYSFGYFAIAGG